MRTLVAAALLAVALVRCGGTEPPNIVLIVVDDLRVSNLSSYGYERETSPFLDGLARRGVLFETVISQSSWTKTSMASVLTSLNPDSHGVLGELDVLADGVVMAPEVFKNAGYRTFCAHGNPWMAPEFGFDQGYDRFVYSHWHKEDMSGERVVAEALNWLREDSTEPFFLYAHFMDVHSPFVAPDGFDVFGDTQRDAYDASILYVDAQLRALSDGLDRLGVLDNTWFVFTSDHGEEFGEHGDPSGHGQTLYREVLEVPLIFYHPDMAAGGRRVSRQVRLVDVAPTLLDLAGSAAPPSMQGQSLLTDFADAPRENAPLAVSRVVSDKGDLISFTTSRSKYVLDFASGSEALYDLVQDPREMVDVAGRYPDQVERLREQALQIKAAGLESAEGFSLTGIDEELREALEALGYLR